MFITDPRSAGRKQEKVFICDNCLGEGVCLRRVLFLFGMSSKHVPLFFCLGEDVFFRHGPRARPTIFPSRGECFFDMGHEHVPLLSCLGEGVFAIWALSTSHVAATKQRSANFAVRRSVKYRTGCVDQGESEEEGDIHPSCSAGTKPYTYPFMSPSLLKHCTCVFLVGVMVTATRITEQKRLQKQRERAKLAQQPRK